MGALEICMSVYPPICTSVRANFLAKSMGIDVSDTFDWQLTRLKHFLTLGLDLLTLREITMDITLDLQFLNIHNPLTNERISVYLDKHNRMSLNTKDYIVKQISLLSKGVVIETSA